MLINSISDFRRAMRNGQYAWPGGYQLYFVMADGEALSFQAARANVRQILEAICARDIRPRDQWLPLGVEVNWEDNDLRCCDSDELIPAAYGEG